MDGIRRTTATRGQRRGRPHGRGGVVSRAMLALHSDPDGFTWGELDAWRPLTRSECEHADRPCPWFACRYHLAGDVTDAGSVALRFPQQSIGELRETCALDVAARGGLTLEEVAALLNLTRERVRQVEASGLAKLRTVLVR